MHRNRNRSGSRSGTVALLLATGALVATPLACGKTTELGNARTSDGGSSGQSPTGGSSGQSPDGGNALGSAGEGGDGGSSAGGSSGEGGSSADAGAGGSDAGAPCMVPRPAPNSNVTQQERERAELIHDFCQTLADQDCLRGFVGPGTISAQATGCGLDDRVLACEQDSLFYALRNPADCEDEWRALLNCHIAADHTPETCSDANGIGRNTQGDPTGPPCDAEGSALETCALSSPSNGGRITGSRGFCYYRVMHEQPSRCHILCPVGDNQFTLDCTTLPGLPTQCICNVNDHVLNDDSTGKHAVYAADCSEAARAVVDGECIDRLDCCFTYKSPSGTEYCTCTSDPGARGYASCEDAAREGGGAVVPICPKYKFVSDGCWPPDSCP
jgi:hypothetical protein